MDQSIGQIELDGLGQVRIEASAPTSGCVLTWCVVRQREDCGCFNIVAAPQQLAHLPSIKLRCVEVEKDHVRAKQGREVEHIRSSVNRADQVSSAFEKPR
jgi:hypothetical protein